MADALCGSSNPLQSFQKHATVDRTLQQDRLRSAAPPAQGFRSFDPRQSSLDNEFATFEAGQPFQSLPQQPLPFDAVRSSHGQLIPAQSLAGGSASWANDFQKLRLTGPGQPIPQSQFRTEAPLHRSQPGASGWHAEFMRNQRGRQATLDMAPQQSYVIGQHSVVNTAAPMAFNGYDMAQVAQADQLQSYPVKTQGEPMNDAAFDEAFARMESEHLDRLEGLKKELEDQIKPTVDQQSETIRIGSDLIEERKPPENEHQEKADADELARTAGDLLNALKHDQSDKFQQSQFLSFMRRIRDREVEIKGEDFVETNHEASLRVEEGDHQQALHPGGRYYPERPPPPVEELTIMSGAINGSDLDQFRQMPESHSLVNRFVPTDDAIQSRAYRQALQGLAYRQEGQSTA